MAEAKQLVRWSFSLLLIAATGLGLYNTFGDNVEVRQKAEGIACGKPGCSLRMTREARNPIGQSFEYQLSERPGMASVDCHRAFYLLGEWGCELTSSPAPGGRPAPSASK